MEISFSTQGEIQVVTIIGGLGESEAAAVRFKLEQKINQGRFKVLFDASQYTVTDDAARNFLLGIISYAVMRGALSACSGVPTQHWALMIMPGNQQVKLFISLSEGVDYLNKSATPDAQKKANLGKKLEGKGKEAEDEIKQGALTDLLRKYEIFQQNDSDDPFRLNFYVEQYKTNPNHEALAAERKAKESFTKTVEEIDALGKECDDLATKVKGYMIMRKQPLTGKELELKHKTLTYDLGEQKQVLDNLKSQIATNTEARDEALSIGELKQSEFEQELTDIENKIKDATTENDKLTQDFTAKDLEEQKIIESLKAQLPQK
ncbi:MAG: hypothetical protein SGI74_00820 [Oligoflexia bacterium]|nr:hypothetical protein [Oligoflexia bacterium]